MSRSIYTVKYVTSKTCFCYLPDENAMFMSEGAALQLRYRHDQVAYLSYQSSPSLKHNEVGLNNLQARALNIQENDTVVVSLSAHVPGIRKITISPASQEDYEILELLAENVESTLLNQIRVVNQNQKFVIWISGSIHVTVNVDLVEPVSPGRLDNLTEVAVKFEIAETPVKNELGSGSTVGFSAVFGGNPSQNDLCKGILDTSVKLHSPLAFILHPVEDLPDYNCYSLKFQHFNVFVLKQHLPNNLLQFVESSDCNSIFSLKIGQPPLVGSGLIDDRPTIKAIKVRLCVLDNNSNIPDVKDYAIPIMYVHNSIFQNFKIKVGAKAFLGDYVEDYPTITGMEISTTKDRLKDALKMFRGFLTFNCAKEKLVLNSDFVLRHNFESSFLFLVKFLPPTSSFCVIDFNFVRNCKITVADSELGPICDTVGQELSGCDLLEDFGPFRGIIDDSIGLLKMGIVSSCFKPENVLIVGKHGAGKSALTKILAHKLSLAPFYIHTATISCKNIKGKSLESLHNVFLTKIMDLVYYQPSVLILEDLHIICEKVTEGDVMTQEALHANRVSEMLADLLKSDLKHSKISILATTESALKLNQQIFASRGQHLFKNIFEIGELAKDDRMSLMRFLFRQKCELGDDVDLEQFSLKTEGFVVQDLVDFVDKAVFESLKESEEKVRQRNCEVSLKNTSALSLKDVQLHSPGDRDFSDVGGLEGVKKVLVECLMWPVQVQSPHQCEYNCIFYKYPNLFGSAPLRLQSGLLLYGPPGTGKTILAGAAAKHCGLRLISVKGPELLSKYIGASEQAVRNVFEKAQSAKPCILFFDEFDSLAPRRGHDSTGVTDRVVNQLLTQLDGVESLSGVCVLAATSRPDLLDPALLRPGRLDRQILCPFPDKDARLKILQTLSKKMTLGADVDLTKVAERTNGFSGADLQSVLYTAQLSVVEHLLEESKENSDDVKEINQSHLVKAVKSTRPSLTKDEKLKYERIYSRFQQGSDVKDIMSGLQRATLA